MKVNIFTIDNVEDGGVYLFVASSLAKLLVKLSKNYSEEFKNKKDVFDFIKDRNEWGECGWGDCFGEFFEEEVD